MKMICNILNATDGSRKQEAQASKPATYLTSRWTSESCMCFFCLHLCLFYKVNPQFTCIELTLTVETLLPATIACTETPFHVIFILWFSMVD